MISDDDWSRLHIDLQEHHEAIEQATVSCSLALQIVASFLLHQIQIVQVYIYIYIEIKLSLRGTSVRIRPKPPQRGLKKGFHGSRMSR